ncbi:MAG: hypothetical protein LKM39_12790 [Chiayiivirga sp.]|nr:hypothetical protein [Chiayiivirga sp.]
MILVELPGRDLRVVEQPKHIVGEILRAVALEAVEIDQLRFPVTHQVGCIRVAITTQKAEAAFAGRLWPVFLGQ